MLSFPGQPLPESAVEKLALWQALVNSAGPFPDQVDAAKRLFKQYNVKRNAVFAQVRKTLSSMCVGARRCCYCEDSMADEVEHIKPKDFYPEAVFGWDNYFYACGPCNGQKNNKCAVFDEGGKRVDVFRKQGQPVTQPPQGDQLLINPRTEDPLDYLWLDIGNSDGGAGSFYFLGSLASDARKTARAAYTIELLDLNRDVLVIARENAFTVFLSLLSEHGALKSAGAPQTTLANLAKGVKGMNHQTVWREMKRQRSSLGQLNQLFVASPEAIYWND